MVREAPGLETRQTRSRRQIASAVLAFLCVVAGGTAAFSWVEKWSVGQSLYFTLVTVTTVGYGDEGISDAGRAVAAVLLLGGIGIATYTFALIAQTAVSTQLAWRKRMQSRILRLENHVIVCGFGRMGQTICAELLSSERAFVVIERDPAAFDKACECSYLVVEGDAGRDEVMVSAGIERASHVVSAVDSESENIVITLTARELRPGMPIIARAEWEEEVRKLRRAGATRMVSPFRSGGIEVANAIVRPKVADFLARSTRSESDVALTEVVIEEGSPLAGVSLAEYGRCEGSRISFVALERPGKDVTIPPRGSEVLLPGDLLIVAGHPEDVVRMRDRGCAGAVRD